MKSTESQYGYIFKLNQQNKFCKYSRLSEMYYLQELKTNLLMDSEFNFLEDINSKLEFYHQQVIDSGKPLIIKDCKLEDDTFVFGESSINEDRNGIIIPIYHYEEIVAVIGMIGCPIKFNIFYYELFQPFMILCSELIASLL